MIHLIIKHQKENIKIDTNNMGTIIVIISVGVCLALAQLIYYISNNLNKK
jgi:cell division protein FtsX